MKSTGKKGQAYSVIVLLIIIPIFIFVIGFLSATQDSSAQRTDRIIADQMSQVARNIEDDFVRAIQTTGRRALVAEINQILTTGQPIDNATLRMQELMINGTMNGNVSVLMFNNTLPDWRQKILSTEIGFNRNITYGFPSIANLDGFSLRISMSLDINLSHNFSFSRISKTVKKNISVSVEGLDDPLYILNSGGNVQRQIIRYPYRSFAIKILTGTRTGNCTGPAVFQSAGSADVYVVYNASGESGYEGVVSETPELPSVGCYSVGNSNAVDTINATILVQNYTTLYIDELTGVWLLPISSGLQYYNMFSSGGPDFLKRLEGRLDPSANGLESFVMDATGIEYKATQSRIDYRYFSNATIQGSRVRGLPSWLRINTSAGGYNLTELLES